MDTGVGISPEHINHLFERFYRVDHPTSAEYSGNGLGLSIAKGIMDAHHGKITISSKEGHGTTVILELPKA